MKLECPSPRMIGATIICKRSRQPAARKFDTVAAPPSIRIRRNPRFASSATIVAGGMRPPVTGKARISVFETGGYSVPSDVMIRRRTPSSVSALAVAGSRPFGSITTRAGLGPSTSRTVSCGSSASTVPIPTTTASTSERNLCKCARPVAPLMYFECPETVAMRPSSDCPIWATTTKSSTSPVFRGPNNSVQGGTTSWLGPRKDCANSSQEQVTCSSVAALFSLPPALVSVTAAGVDLEDTGALYVIKRTLFFWASLTQTNTYYDPTGFVTGIGHETAVLMLEGFGWPINGNR